MTNFAFQARDRSGQQVSGTREADDQRAALEALREDGLFVTKLQATRETVRAEAPRAEAPRAEASRLETASHAPENGVPSTPAPRTPAAPTQTTAPATTQPFLQANAKQLALYFRQMHAMLHAGTGLAQALALMGEHAPSRGLQRASAEMSRRAATGTPWSETMPSYPGLFSELMIGMISAGERGGFLDRMCLRLAEYSERDYDIQQTIKRETWYPKLLVFCSIFIPSVVPLVLQGFDAWLKVVLPPLIVIGVLFAGWKLIKLLAPSLFHEGPLAYWIDWLKLLVPVAGKTVRSLATAKFCRAFGALSSAGMGIGPTIELSARACGNAAIAEKARRVIPQVERGQTMTEALRSTHVFPAIAIQMLHVGETAGNIEEQLEKVAEFQEQDAETTIKQAVKVWGIVVFLAIALYIGSQVVSFYSGYTQELNDIMDATDQAR
jgi:type II secretory pathway component PulF